MTVPNMPNMPILPTVPTVLNTARPDPATRPPTSTHVHLLNRLP